ncbi:ImmA/IrrE family metallo-endopeptidase [Anaerosphaera multitolerans]|uniref:ImmA/IrrE family metallo-endopeptidase n=1 Tax=Anaerosphaera multitolerans TaxID=2487351 RepID=A0A437S7F3_9FIRM|nr:ImmA/IrrE family metallo-endopeptidase [Anaerosphaera multitolerans]
MLYILYSNLSEEIQRQTCAHELGHIKCMHRDNIAYTSTNTLFVTDKQENDANIFLCYLFLSEYTKTELMELTKKQIANMIGVEERVVNLL